MSLFNTAMMTGGGIFPGIVLGSYVNADVFLYDASKIYLCSNGTVSSTAQFIPPITPGTLTSFDILGETGYTTTTSGAVYKTTDGGNNFYYLNTLSPFSGTGDVILGPFLKLSPSGYIYIATSIQIGAPYFYSGATFFSSNGGSSYIKGTTPSYLGNPGTIIDTFGYRNILTVPSNSTMFFNYSSTAIAKSSNSGLTSTVVWDGYTLFGTQTTPYAINAYDTNYVYASGDLNDTIDAVIYSTDGTNFNIFTGVTYPQASTDIASQGQNKAFIGSNKATSGKNYFTLDNQVTMNTYATLATITKKVQSIQFNKLDKQKGYIFGVTAGDTGVLYKTTDGGTNYSQILTTSENNLTIVTKS